MAHNKFPLHGYLGLVLVATFWYLNWTLPGLRTHWGFFPLWLGYCLSIDALTYRLKGDSLLTRDTRLYFLMFMVSIPFWWLFEALNVRARYWEYIPVDSFSDLAYALYCTLNFSIVLPAVFCTAQLFWTFSWLRRIPPFWKVGRKSTTIWGFFISDKIR